jgi:hypothetical protein
VGESSEAAGQLLEESENTLLFGPLFEDACCRHEAGRFDVIPQRLAFLLWKVLHGAYMASVWLLSLQPDDEEIIEETALNGFSGFATLHQRFPRP